MSDRNDSSNVALMDLIRQNFADMNVRIGQIQNTMITKNDMKNFADEVNKRLDVLEAEQSDQKVVVTGHGSFIKAVTWAVRAVVVLVLGAALTAAGISSRTNTPIDEPPAIHSTHIHK